jgi:ubiquinol-cytochrome c reductase iron-sulfur subunit
MADQHENQELVERSAGTAIVTSDAVANPGFPPPHQRVGDVDPKKAKSAERGIIALFFISIIGSVGAIAAYIMFPIHEGDLMSVRLNTMFFGLGGALALLAIGIGAVHWAKALMHGHDLVEERHETRSSEPTRVRAAEIFTEANAESGFTRRKLLRNSLITAAVVSPLPAVVLLRDLAPAADPNDLLRHTMWKSGMRLVRDPTGGPIRAADVTLGSAFHVIPDGLLELHDALEQKAKAAVLLMRLKPEDLHPSPGREDWAYQGIVAYSKICTHVGCPVALYEQQTHHLLCPCHQSQFDITREAAVIFGPAKRPLPQLPITVDEEGYLIAQSDFTEPVGPSFWERSR